MNIHPEVFIPYDVQLRIKNLFPTCTDTVHTSVTTL